MYAWFYQSSTLLGLPILSMVIFMVVFLGAAVRAWRKHPAANGAFATLPLTSERVVAQGGRHV